MMRLHQSGPRLRCLRVPTAHRLDRNLAQIRQTAAHVRDLRFDPQPSDSFKAVSPGWLRQLQQTATVQFGQSFATTHLPQSAVRRPPIQPATNTTGQGTSRNSRIPADQLLNPFQYDGAKVLTANVHAPRIRGNARGVKCVPRSAHRVCSSLAPCQRAWGPAAKCTPYFLTAPNVQILVRRSRIFSPRRREEREEKRFQKLRVLRVFAVDFLGCGWAALCSSVVSFCLRVLVVKSL